MGGNPFLNNSMFCDCQIKISSDFTWLCNSGISSFKLMISRICKKRLTNNKELVSFAPFWLCVDLAFIDSCVIHPCVPDVKDPIRWGPSKLCPDCGVVCHIGVDRVKSLVIGVESCSHGEDVKISLPDPWNLESIKETFILPPDIRTLWLMTVIFQPTNRRKAFFYVCFFIPAFK